MSYDFVIRAYLGTFVDGPLVGVRKELKVFDVTADHWRKLKAVGYVDAAATRNNAKARRDGCKQIVIMWCEALTTNDSAAVADFEEKWGLSNSVFDTPEKKRRRTHNSETAAVAEPLAEENSQCD